MTVIRPNSISGINSITANGGDINIFRSNGAAGDLIINNIVGAAATFTGVLSYEDVTNVDSVGLITARGGIRIGAGTTVGPVSGIVTYFGDGSQLTGISVDSTKIETGNTKVETIDTGSDGHVKITTEGTERLRIDSTGDIGLGESNPNRTGFASPVVSVGYNTGNGYSVLELLGNKTDDNTISNIVAYNVGGSSRLAAIGFERSGANNSGAIRFDTYTSGSSSERMRISKEGYVTKPNTPAFFATHTGNNASDSTGYITYNTGGPYYNNGNHFNVNGRFTVPITGIYHMHFHCFVHNSATQQNVEIIMRRFNSDGGGQTTLTRGFDNKVNGNYGPPVSMTWTGPLTATQYVQVYSANELHHANGYYFGGYLVG